jgi:biotin carboxyl carrier protein
MRKTTEEMRADRERLARLIDTPGIAPDIKETYRRTVARIDELLAAERQVGEQGAAPAPHPGERPAIILPEVEEPRKMPQERAAPAPAPTPQPTRENAAPANVARNSAPAADAPAKPTALQVSAPTPGRAIEVEIAWANGKVEKLEEGVVASDFRQRFGELLASQRVEQGRWHDVPRMTTFYRACVYYRAMCAIWQREPTPREAKVGVKGEGSPSATLWSMIIEHSKSYANEVR